MAKAERQQRHKVQSDGTTSCVLHVRVSTCSKRCTLWRDGGGMVQGHVHEVAAGRLSMFDVEDTTTGRREDTIKKNAKRACVNWALSVRETGKEQKIAIPKTHH